MSEGRQLAGTGLGTLTVLGVAVGTWWVVAAAVVLVLVGVLLLKFGWRRDRPAAG